MAFLQLRKIVMAWFQITLIFNAMTLLLPFLNVANHSWYNEMYYLILVLCMISSFTFTSVFNRALAYLRFLY
jgi:hypothetical protein